MHLYLFVLIIALLLYIAKTLIDVHEGLLITCKPLGATACAIGAIMVPVIIFTSIAMFATHRILPHSLETSRLFMRVIAVTLLFLINYHNWIKRINNWCKTAFYIRIISYTNALKSLGLVLFLLSIILTYNAAYKQGQVDYQRGTVKFKASTVSVEKVVKTK